MSPGSLHEWLTQTAIERSSEQALTFVKPRREQSVSYSFESLFNQVEVLARKLARRYENRSAPLGLLLASQEDQVLHYLSALSIGLVPAILTPPNRKLNREYYVETMSEVLRRCDFGALVTDVHGLDFGGLQMTPFDFEIKAAVEPSRHAKGATGSLAGASFLQFSSGTTGIKKGVIVDDDSVMAQLRAYSEALALSHDDCIISWLPLYHDMGFIACLNMPLAVGVHTVMIDPIDWVSDPAIYLRQVSEHGGTLSWHPNFAFAFMANRVSDKSIEGISLSSLRGLVNCSEPVTYDSQHAFAVRFEGWGLSEDVFKGCYAMAETTFALTHGNSDDPGYVDSVGPSRSGGPNQTYVSVGRPLPGVEMKIVDPDSDVEKPEREVGEILARSPFTFRGYFNDEASTDSTFVDGWYRTGDLGYRVGSDFYVVGRRKDVMIVAGVNVFPQDVELVVSEVEGVYPGRVSAFAVFDAKLQSERVIVLAEADTPNQEEQRRISREIRQRILAAFQIGDFQVALVPRTWLIKSTSGKVARQANREKWLDAAQSTGALRWPVRNPPSSRRNAPARQSPASAHYPEQADSTR
jgi:fatty-acyl-CoA synthase